jgi:uncharacterized protein with HEPN domain
VSYRDRQRLADIQAAIDAIGSHLQRGTLADGLVFDAARIRLLEIGEAVKALPADLLATQPAIPWSQITRMRGHLAHRYFDTAHAILQSAADDDLPELERAIHALTASLPGFRGADCGVAHLQCRGRGQADHTLLPPAGLCSGLGARVGLVSRSMSVCCPAIDMTRSSLAACGVLIAVT